MADKTGYIGRNPGDSSVTIARQTFTPTSDTTEFTFTAGYNVGLCDVYLNGAKLIDATDYDANTGTTVGLTSAASNGDVVEIVAYKAFNLGQVSSSSGNFTVGSQLSVGSTSTLSGVVTTGGDLYVGGVIYGDGSELEGVSAAGIGSEFDSTTGTLGNLIYETPRNFYQTGVTSAYINAETSSGNIAFTRLDEIRLGAGATLHIGAGTTMIMNVLNLF